MLSRALVEISEIYLFIYCLVGCSSTIFGYNSVAYFVFHYYSFCLLFVIFLWFYISRQFCVFIIASNALFHLEICNKKKPFLALKRLFPFGTRHLTSVQIPPKLKNLTYIKEIGLTLTKKNNRNTLCINMFVVHFAISHIIFNVFWEPSIFIKTLECLSFYLVFVVIELHLLVFF